jgi:hypothetical protein
VNVCSGVVLVIKRLRPVLGWFDIGKVLTMCREESMTILGASIGNTINKLPMETNWIYERFQSIVELLHAVPPIVSADNPRPICIHQVS